MFVYWTCGMGGWGHAQLKQWSKVVRRITTTHSNRSHSNSQWTKDDPTYLLLCKTQVWPRRNNVRFLHGTATYIMRSRYPESTDSMILKYTKIILLDKVRLFFLRLQVCQFKHVIRSSGSSQNLKNGELVSLYEMYHSKNQGKSP